MKKALYIIILSLFIPSCYLFMKWDTPKPRTDFHYDPKLSNAEILLKTDILDYVKYPVNSQIAIYGDNVYINSLNDIVIFNKSDFSYKETINFETYFLPDLSGDQTTEITSVLVDENGTMLLINIYDNLLLKQEIYKLNNNYEVIEKDIIEINLVKDDFYSTLGLPGLIYTTSKRILKKLVQINNKLYCLTTKISYAMFDPLNFESQIATLSTITDFSNLVDLSDDSLDDSYEMIGVSWYYGEQNILSRCNSSVLHSTRYYYSNPETNEFHAEVYSNNISYDANSNIILSSDEEKIIDLSYLGSDNFTEPLDFDYDGEFFYLLATDDEFVDVYRILYGDKLYLMKLKRVK